MVRLIKNNEFERIQKEVVMVYFMVLSQHLPGENGENHKKIPVSRMRLDWGRSNMNHER